MPHKNKTKLLLNCFFLFKVSPSSSMHCIGVLAFLIHEFHRIIRVGGVGAVLQRNCAFSVQREQIDKHEADGRNVSHEKYAMDSYYYKTQLNTD